ncbi:MAG: hypothetical protein RSG07_04785 [Erysipelotrichaceae bacterium]
MKQIFPFDVNSVVSRSAFKTSGDKKSFVIGMYVVTNIVLFFILLTILGKVFNLGIGWTFLVLLILNLTLGTLLFRFLIFDEEEKIKEHNGLMSDSFARFYHIRKDTEEIIEVAGGNPINVFEYSDGTLLVGLKFRYGSNDKVTAQRTSEVLSDIYKAIAKNGFENRLLTDTEDFEETEDCDEIIEHVNEIDNPELSKTMMNIVEGILKETREHSNVDCTTLFLRSKGLADIFDLTRLLNDILNILTTSSNLAFRSVDFLDKPALLNTIKTYYGLEAIDLSMIKLINPDEELVESYQRLVKLYKIEINNGPPLVKSSVIDEYFVDNDFIDLN